jgi:hypothetical protein
MDGAEAKRIRSSQHKPQRVRRPAGHEQYAIVVVICSCATHPVARAMFCCCPCMLYHQIKKDSLRI